jgi:AcrR family transcriptional regulator
MATKNATRSSARDRLLDAANELFYEEGVHSVGIDRIIEQAGVAKPRSTTPSAARRR